MISLTLPPSQCAVLCPPSWAAAFPNTTLLFLGVSGIAHLIFHQGWKLKAAAHAPHTYPTLHNWQRLPWLWLKGSWEKSSGWEELSIINKSHACTQRAVLTQTKHFPPSEVSALCSVNRKITCPTLQTKMLCSKGDRIITYSNYHSLSLENSPSGQIHLHFCPCTWTSTKQAPFTLSVLHFEGLLHSKLSRHHPGSCSPVVCAVHKDPIQQMNPTAARGELLSGCLGCSSALWPLLIGLPMTWMRHLAPLSFSTVILLKQHQSGSVYKKEIQLVTNSFLQPHSMASGFSSLLQALPTGSPPDVSTAFNNCPIPCKLGPLERTDAFGYNPLHRCRGTLRKG